MAIVNPLLNVKDSRWLQLEVCREFQRNKCTRPDAECKFAHPAANVEVQNGRVIACYDSIKGRCNREKPPCKYFHPPKHLKDQLIINGKNHLALKNALLQQVPFQTVLTSQLPMVGSVANLLNTYPRNLSPSSMVNPQPYASVAAYASALNGQSKSMITNNPVAKAPNPYLTNLPALAAASSAAAAAAYGAYSAPSPAAMLMNAEQLSSSYGLTSTSSTAPASVSSPGTNKSRLETVVTGSATGGTGIEPHVIAEASSLNAVATAAAAAAAAAGRKRTREQTSDELLMQLSGAYPVNKRTAVDKNGAPLYPGAAPPTATTYPQPLAVHQPFVPLSFKITVFYIIFYLCLAAFWALMLLIFYQTLDERVPKFQLSESRIGANPGLGFRPRPRDENIGSTLIWFKNGKESSEWNYWSKSLESFLKPYTQGNQLDAGSHVDPCTGNKAPEAGKFCYFDIKTIDNNCTIERNFGYDRGQPCVLIKLNRIFNWKPEPYTDEDLANNKNIPQEVHKGYREGRNDIVYITCEGENAADKESIGPISYYPQQGIDFKYFPFTNQPGYLSPFVFVHFSRPTSGLVINVECKAWARNIKHNRMDREGSVHFEIQSDGL